MNANEAMQYASYILVAVGVMAFLVSVITQTVKNLPGLCKIPTAAVVMALSLVLCPTAYMAVMAWASRSIEWYELFACFLAAFIVALVAMDGWERVAEIWQRTKYNRK